MQRRPELGCGEFPGAKIIGASTLPSEEELRAWVSMHDVVINCIADGRVDACEKNPELSRKINLDFAETVMRIAASAGLYHISFSTNLVFDGSKAPYEKDDVLSPVGQYGRQKAELENLFRSQYQSSGMIVRTLFAIGQPYPEAFRSNPAFDLILNPPASVVRAVDDVFNNPVLASDVGSFIADAVFTRKHGVFNVAGAERLSRYQLFKKIFDVCGYDGSLLASASDSDFPGLPRPKDTTLLPNLTPTLVDWGIREIFSAVTGVKKEVIGTTGDFQRVALSDGKEIQKRIKEGALVYKSHRGELWLKS